MSVPALYGTALTMKHEEHLKIPMILIFQNSHRCPYPIPLLVKFDWKWLIGKNIFGLLSCKAGGL
jgi:hypothetical protein